MLYLTSILILAAAYLLGSVSFAVILSKKISGEDIRNSGSGNAGATNMLRVHGKAAGAMTLLGDALKGVAAVLIGLIADRIITAQTGMQLSWFEENILFGNLKYLAGIFVVLGHDFPVFFGFKGGKGVATGLGVMLMTDWRIGLIIAASAILIMLISRYVSLGSIVGGILYPTAVIALMVGEGDINWVYFASALALGIITASKHHANIKRLVLGTENKLFSKKST